MTDSNTDQIKDETAKEEPAAEGTQETSVKADASGSDKGASNRSNDGGRGRNNRNGKSGGGHGNRDRDNSARGGAKGANTSRGPRRGQMRPMVEPEGGYDRVPVELKSLLDAGAHFGHRVEKWNPKMLKYIFGERNGVHILNLDITLELWERATKFITDIVSRGGTVLFVGTKLQARTLVRDAANRSGAFYVNNRWLGGTMSNFETIKRSTGRLSKLEDLLAKAQNPESEVKLGKKERLGISRQVEKLEVNLGGIRDMRELPDVLFVVDVNKEAIAVAEARKLHIPVVALVDTNVDPSVVQFPIPANDDAARTIRLMVDGVADAVIAGRSSFESKMKQMAEKRETERAEKERQLAELRAAAVKAQSGENAVQ